MESVWLDTNVTALYTTNLQKTDGNLISQEVENNLTVLLVGVGSRLEVYQPSLKVFLISLQSQT